MPISEKIGKLAGTLGLGNRFYYMAMDQSRTRLLNEIWVRKQNMRNQQVRLDFCICNPVLGTSKRAET